MRDVKIGSKDQRRISLKSFKTVNNPRSIHGIYPYRGKISALDANHIISQMPPHSILLDPFCGTGTIIYEAQKRGMKAIGVDNNPLACTIAKGKTEPVDKDATVKGLEIAISEAKSLGQPSIMPTSPSKYFHPRTSEQIMRLIAVSDGFSEFLLSVLYGSVCVAARACSGWKWSSTSVGKISDSLRDVDFYSILMRKMKKHIDFVCGSPTATIHCHDTRRLSDVISKASVDVVYSSPPYFDALDYTGYYSRIVLEILGVDRSSIRRGLIQRYSTYREDMIVSLEAIDRALVDDGLVVLVVGDRKVNGRLIKGAEFLAEIAPWENPYVVERSYSSTASSIWDKINKTHRKEQVIIWDLSTNPR